MTLGECINSFLQEHDMSMRTFASRAGMSHTYISYIINGKTARGDAPVPTIDKYRQIANAMGIDVNELISKVDDDIAWGSNPPSPVLSSSEAELVADYRDASEEIREEAAGMLHRSAERNRKEGSSSACSAG